MRIIQANQQQRIERDHLTFEAWGERLSLEQFLQREQTLREMPWCKKFLTTWILEDERHQPLSSCETYESSSFLANQGASKSLIKKGKSLGIASVYTAPQFQKQGHAAKMISLLTDKIKTSPENYHSIFLYSEIGAKYYEKLGFQLVESKEWVLTAQEQDANFQETDESRLPRWITRGEFNQHPQIFLERPRPLKYSTQFCIWPEAEQIQWHFKRQDLYQQFLKQAVSDKVGAQTNQSRVIWMADYKHDTLRILLIHAENADDAKDLLLAARKHAQSLDLHEVRSWTHPLNERKNEPWVKNNLFWESFKETERNDSLAMIYPLSPGLQASHWGGIMRSIWV